MLGMVCQQVSIFNGVPVSDAAFCQGGNKMGNGPEWLG